MIDKSQISDEIIEKATNLALTELDQTFFVMYGEGYNYGKALRELTDKYINQLVENQSVKIVDKRQQLKKTP